jgi:hypothetical protein
MSKSSWISGTALLLLLPAPLARADESPAVPGLKGPARVEVHAEAIKAPDQQGPVKVYVHRQEGPAGTVQVQVQTDGGKVVWPQLEKVTEALAAESQRLVRSEYWIGLGCSPVPAALRAQLGLPDDQGVVVEQVVPDSPAAKAEIKQHDVLLKAGEKPLKTVQDLIDAIEAAKDKQLAIELIRGGKRMEIKVVPAKQPEHAQPGGTPNEALQKWLEGLHRPGAKVDEAAKRALERYLEQLKSAEGWKGPLRWRIFGPGAILPPGAWPGAPLPADLSITISKQGDQPAKITVKQGEKKWEVTEEELGKLPEDIRPHVERMLGRVVAGPEERRFNFDFVPDWERALPPALENRLEKRLEDMNKRIDQLRKSIEELRERRSRTRNTPAENENSDRL